MAELGECYICFQKVGTRPNGIPYSHINKTIGELCLGSLNDHVISSDLQLGKTLEKSGGEIMKNVKCPRCGKDVGLTDKDIMIEHYPPPGKSLGTDLCRPKEKEDNSTDIYAGNIKHPDQSIFRVTS